MTKRYALSRGGFFVHILPGDGLIALCGDTGFRSNRKRAFWVVLTAKCPGPIPGGRKLCSKCEEVANG